MTRSSAATDYVCPKHVLLCDDHTVFGSGLGAVVRGLFPEAEVRLCATLAALRHELASPRPLDLVLADYQLGDGSIDELGPLLCERAPVLVISAQENPRLIQRLLASGVRGFVSKAAPLRELEQAILSVGGGGTHVPQELSRTGHTPHYGGLTSRQVQVASLLAEGFTNREIRDELGIAENTVKAHLREIFKALGVSNRTEAAVAWLRLHG